MQHEEVHMSDIDVILDREMAIVVKKRIDRVVELDFVEVEMWFFFSRVYERELF